MHYCYSCNRDVDSTVRMIRESYRDGTGKFVTKTTLSRVCTRCGKDIPDNKLNDCNVRKVFAEHQKKVLDREHRKSLKRK